MRLECQSLGRQVHHGGWPLTALAQVSALGPFSQLSYFHTHRSFSWPIPIPTFRITLSSTRVYNLSLAFRTQPLRILFPISKTWEQDWHGSVQFSRSVMSDSLRPHESQHSRPPCPSPTPRVYSDSCPSSRWCHPVCTGYSLKRAPSPVFILFNHSFFKTHTHTESAYQR